MQRSAYTARLARHTLGAAIWNVRNCSRELAEVVRGYVAQGPDNRRSARAWIAFLDADMREQGLS